MNKLLLILYFALFGFEKSLRLKHWFIARCMTGRIQNHAAFTIALLLNGILPPVHGQNSSNQNLNGTWSNIPDSIDRSFDAYFSVRKVLVISADTILIMTRDDKGTLSSQELMKYAVVNDTLIGTELEYFKFDGNLGFALKHYKNRHVVQKIPVCIFRNDCPENRNLSFMQNAWEFPFRKVSETHIIHWTVEADIKKSEKDFPGIRIIKDY